MLGIIPTPLPPQHDCVEVKAGTYQVGSAQTPTSPIRKVRLNAFCIAKFETTNAQFAEFVKATKFVTDAERLGNGMTFTPPLREFQWKKDKSAFWMFPNGKSNGGIEDKMNHPVTCISYRDAEAYCRWAGGRLPTIDEWEVSTRAGTRTDRFFGANIGDIRKFGNVWHLQDHKVLDETDGYGRTSPVGSFEANPMGLYDVYGNVFEFCTGKLPGKKKRPYMGFARGGSWWCSRWTCCSFNSFDIAEANIRSSFSNQGFRIVYDLATKIK
jgi:formylglycine-generating enzyme